MAESTDLPTFNAVRARARSDVLAGQLSFGTYVQLTGLLHLAETGNFFGDHPELERQYGVITNGN